MKPEKPQTFFYFQVKEFPEPLNIPTPTPCTRPGWSIGPTWDPGYPIASHRDAIDALLQTTNSPLVNEPGKFQLACCSEFSVGNLWTLRCPFFLSGPERSKTKHKNEVHCGGDFKRHSKVHLTSL